MTPVPVGAQGGPIDASPAPSAPSPAPSAPTPTPTPSPSPSPDPAPRPARGPSVRERGGRRSRGASTASGALMLFMLVGFMGYYVVKRLRR
jgi:hypothetical protein